MKKLIFYHAIIASIFICCKQQTSNTNESVLFTAQSPQTTSLLSQELNSSAPSEELTKRWEEKRSEFHEDSTDVDNIIWYGRFTAYMGGYREAIDIYSDGIKRHPDDARLYRHRGHRYISLREFDQAIADFKIAESLIEGKDNEVEPDGMPNERNIPVSSLHGNIFYHLGLAYYLKGDWENANTSYQKCLATSRMPDNVVSASHWLYMINRIMGHNDEANEYVSRVAQDDDIIENHSYHQLCLLYNGTYTEEEASSMGSSSSANDAVLYGIANWHFYNGDQEKGNALKQKIVEGSNWASFGYIAAEADLARLAK